MFFAFQLFQHFFESGFLHVRLSRYPFAADKKNEIGSVMVEVAIFLPLLLALLFFILFITTTINARTSLSQAVTSSRLALTRGQTERIGSEVLSDIQDWHFGAVPSGRLTALLASPGLEGEVPSYYDDVADDTFLIDDHVDLPAHYTYALVYAHQSMKQSLGSSVRYPCNPNDADGAGCLACKNIDPFPYLDSSAGMIGSPTYSRQFVGVECEYRPSNTLLNPFLSLLRMVAGDGANSLLVIKRKSFFIG